MTDAVTAEGLVNLRDLGGYAVSGGGVIRARRLFRSDSLAAASAADVAYLRDEVGLATAVDLRDEREIAEFGRGGLAAAPGLAHVSLPIGDVPDVDGRHTFYFELLRRHGARLAGLVSRLSAPGTLPAIVYCHIGCDRTGVVSAMLLSLAGVAREDVCADYALSTRSSSAIRARADARRRALGLPVMDASYYAAWEPRAEIMAATLELVNGEWGGMPGWADAYGLTPDDIAALRTALVA